MREIKFRKWNGKQMLQVQRLTWSTLDDDLFAFEEGSDKLDCSSHLMQYTGLEDKNGVEIYEGDIVRLKFRDNDPDTYTFESGVIRWHEDSAAFKWFSLTEDPSDGNNYWLTHAEVDWRDVIGNIYENADLLEAKQ